MINEISMNSKDTRAFGWVQDSSSIESLCNVVAVFYPESEFHKKLVNEIIPSVVLEKDGNALSLATGQQTTFYAGHRLQALFNMITETILSQLLREG